MAVRSAIRVLALLLPVLSAPAWSDEPQEEPQQDPKTTVFLELDYFGEPARPVPQPEEFNRWFDAAGFRVEGRLDRNEDLDSDGTCISKAAVEELLVGTRTEEAPEGAWYAHGLVLPRPCVTLWDFQQAVWQHYSYEGLLWPLGAGSETGEREAFVMLDELFGTSEESLKARTFVFAHELAHVLNAHHCELSGDGWEDYDASFGEWSLMHFKQKDANPDEVMPGGDAWCEITEWHQKEIHDAIGCGNDCGELKTRAYDAPQHVTLSVDRERARYFPGEPIYVGLTLAATGRMSGELYYEEGSLDPSSPYLSFSVGETPASMKPMRRSLLGYREPKLKKLSPGETVNNAHLDIWFTLPDRFVQWDPGVDRNKSLWVQAGYTMFEPGAGVASCKGAAIKKCERVRIDSQPVELIIDIDPQKFPRKAHQRFTSPEARRYLWLGGGGHLLDGEKALRKVAGKNTVFKPYANLGLGLGVISRRPVLDEPELNKALKRLEKAEKRKLELPPSLQAVLDEQLKRIKERKNPPR